MRNCVLLCLCAYLNFLCKPITVIYVNIAQFIVTHSNSCLIDNKQGAS